MLGVSAATNTEVGSSRLSPCDLPSAVDQTASRTPESTRTSQDMTVILAVLSRAGCGSLTRDLDPKVARPAAGNPRDK